MVRRCRRISVAGRGWEDAGDDDDDDEMLPMPFVEGC